MTNLEYLTSPLVQLQVLQELTKIKEVLDIYEIADAEELHRVLSRADRLGKILRNIKVSVEPVKTEAVEVCPHCGMENVYPNWNVEKQGYEAVCQHCGKKIMLCDECRHADDNTEHWCDWCEIFSDDGSRSFCFRMKKESANE